MSKHVLLDNHGKPQMKVEGGERVISRKESLPLVEKAVKVKANPTRANLSELGKMTYDIIKKQIQRDGV